MRLLHSIMGGSTTAWVWAYATGQNGRQLGPGAGDRWNIIPHLYRVERDQPPPRPGDDVTRGTFVYNNMLERRAYWTPWGHAIWSWDTERILTPLCGRLRTQSRHPRINAYRQSYRDEQANRPPIRGCPACMVVAGLLGIEPTTIVRLNQNDPWTTVRNGQATRRDWMLQPDPITGL